MEYVNRTYRERLGGERWKPFTVTVKETDLWIGVDRGSFQAEMATFAERFVRQLREEMEEYLAGDPEYAAALRPYRPEDSALLLLRQMAEAARQAGIGPMSAVAGAIAQETGRAIQSRYGTKEVIVENGGDIYVSLRKAMDIAVFAGESPLSQKVGVRIPAEASPLGICTSSGTVGPSLSFGKADAMMVACKDCALADAYATAFANKVQTTADIPPLMEEVKREREVLSAICIKDDKIGIYGNFRLKLFEDDNR